MITIRKADERGRTNLGWLESRHSFSFGQYRDASKMGYRSLRVINDDDIAGGGGFGRHPHEDMEIMTFVLKGSLRHADSMGHEADLGPGEVQYMSAGSGIEHSEHNASATEPVQLYQVWIRPDRVGAQPRYGQFPLTDLPVRDGLRLVASPDGRDGSIPVYQDALVLHATLNSGEVATHALGAGRGVYVQVLSGSVDVNGSALVAGDGAVVENDAALSLTSKSDDTQVVLFDLV